MKNKGFLERKQVLMLVTSAGLLLTLFFSTPNVEAIDKSNANLMNNYVVNLTEGDIENLYSQIVRIVRDSNDGVTVFGLPKLQGTEYEDYNIKYNESINDFANLYNQLRPLGISWTNHQVLAANAFALIETSRQPELAEKELLVRDYLVRAEIAYSSYVGTVGFNKEQSLERIVFRNSVNAQQLQRILKNDHFLTYLILKQNLLFQSKHKDNR